MFGITYLKTWPKNDKTISTRNIKKSTLAIPAAVPATPPKPNTAAIRAMTKNINA